MSIIVAAENGHLDIVKYLTKKGADINAIDDNIKTRTYEQ